MATTQEEKKKKELCRYIDKDTIPQYDAHVSASGTFAKISTKEEKWEFFSDVYIKNSSIPLPSKRIRDDFKMGYWIKVKK